MAKAGQRNPAKISGERSKPRAKRRKRAAQAKLRATTQRFALTVRARGLGLPVNIVPVEGRRVSPSWSLTMLFIGNPHYFT